MQQKLKKVYYLKSEVHPRIGNTYEFFMARKNKNAIANIKKGFRAL